MRCGSRDFRPGPGRAGCTWKTSTSGPTLAAEDTAKLLLAALAAICQRHGYEGFEWWVLAWNEPTIEFYNSLGVELLDEWRVCRLSGQPLQDLAAQAPACAAGTGVVSGPVLPPVGR
ncbi:hypothetical protein YIM_07065 [Amycolatopsis sp. YIM 10]|nr:hypothetical protein YIM_07065 [Amycolatopsis sp. YIM 10]